MFLCNHIFREEEVTGVVNHTGFHEVRALHFNWTNAFFLTLLFFIIQ